MSDEYAGRLVLVTGGAGFIGSHLTEALVGRGAEVVTVVDSLSTGRLSNLDAVADDLNMERMDLVTDDIRPVLAESRFDVVFHLAGNAHVTHSVEDPRMDLEKNLILTYRLLEAMRDVTPETKMVFVSSATVYGEGVRSPIVEDDPKIPESPYGASKLACEHYVRLFSKLYGLPTAIARLFSVYGPRLRKQVVYDLMCKLHRDPNRLFLHGDGSQVRDMNHVSNVTGAILLIAEGAAMKGESYNVAAGEPVSIGNLARRLCAAMGLDPELEFSGEVRPGETQKWFPDPSRLVSLGYENRVTLDEGLRDTVAWFLEHEAPTLPDA